MVAVVGLERDRGAGSSGVCGHADGGRRVGDGEAWNDRDPYNGACRFVHGCAVGAGVVARKRTEKLPSGRALTVRAGSSPPIFVSVTVAVPAGASPRDDDLLSREDGSLRSGEDEREDVDASFHEFVDEAVVGVVPLFGEGVREASCPARGSRSRRRRCPR